MGRLALPMPYRVCVSEGLLRPLPSEIRTRIWLELAQVAWTAAQAHPPRAGWIGVEPQSSRTLQDGYRIVYEVNDATRTVTLVVVSRPRTTPAADPTAAPPEA